MRVVLDTNVVVSALLFGGTPGKLVDLWRSGRIVPVVTGEIVREYLRVLAYPKFKLTEADIDFLLFEEILPFFTTHAIKGKPPVQGSLIPEDPDDEKFLVCAISGNAKFVVSGDAHLLALGVHGDVKIATVKNFLKLTLSDAGNDA